MASLRTSPNTSTPAQWRRLHILRQDHGLSRDAFYDMIAVSSVKELSAKSASEFIERLGGGELPAEPGTKTSDYPRPNRTGAVRIITQSQCDQIARLLDTCFAHVAQPPSAVIAGLAGHAWLLKNFKVDSVRDLATSKRAGQVIRVLKTMKERNARAND